MTEEQAPTKRAPRRKAAQGSEPNAAEGVPAKTTTTRRSAAASTEKKTTPRMATSRRPRDDKQPLADATPPGHTPDEPSVKPEVDRVRPEERYRMIQSAAYFLAEKDGFQGSAIDYWTQAERQIADQIDAQPIAE